jgi:hypothetical protein
MKPYHWSIIFTVAPLLIALAGWWRLGGELSPWFYFAMGLCTGTNLMSVLIDYAREVGVWRAKR